MTTQLTKRQKQVLAYFVEAKATTGTHATYPRYIATDQRIAVALVNKGILNTKDGNTFWVRQPKESTTQAFRLIYLYGFITVDGKEETLVFLKYDQSHAWSIILPAIYRLAKTIGLSQRKDVHIEGVELSHWTETRHLRYQFNGEDFIRIKTRKKQ